MSMNQRAKLILQQLEDKGSVRVSELSKQLGCSEVTIRNDIQKLEDKGLLIRTHGGATRVGAQVSVNYQAGNIYKNADQKQRISQKAYDYIKDNETIILDDASINYYLAKIIKDNPSKHLVVITNSLVAAGILADSKHITLFLLGGQVGGNLPATMGDITSDYLRNIRADKAFISAHGVNFKAGITSVDSPQLQVKKEIIDASREVYLLVDSSKFGGGYIMTICPLSRITRIITDKDIDQEHLKEASSKNINLEVV